MQKYFEEKQNIQGSTEEVIRVIAGRYMSDNPAEPYTYRAFNTNGFMREKGGRVILDFDSKFPEAKDGDYAYAFAKIYCAKDGNSCLSISCRNPNEVYVNGNKVTSTTCQDEVLNDKRTFDFKVTKGYNTIFIKSRKNTLGFCCTIGCYSPKWLPVNFYTAFDENAGELGWNYCGVFEKDIFETIPVENSAMGDMWLPRPDENKCYDTGGKVYAVSFLECEKDCEAAISYKSDKEFIFYADGEEKFTAVGAGTETVMFSSGVHKVSLEFISSPTQFEIKADNAKIFLPDYIKGVRGNWLYIETEDEKAKYGFDEFALYNDKNGTEYFKCGKDSYIRPVLERPIFGKSNYPIGVVLYGLLKAGGYLNDDKIVSYAHEHLLRCCKIHHYATWDCEKFGSACVNHQLLNLSALDDCGSFMSAVLEDYFNYKSDDAVLDLVNDVGDYILNRQERLPNGMFYREMKGHFFQNTVWADDLYMSTPFLMRYSKLKNDKSVLDDVINQFMCFKELLYMPDKKLMSHVYNLTFKKQTSVPWGRGNGWVLFSLSELLQVMPKEHKDYDKIKGFFVELCEGFLSICDENGMCHQVLDDHESYAEASSTAMCAVAFSRGIMLGILPKDIYSTVAEKSVKALREYCIDEDGNVYGVCIGSGYSFTREYYKYDLRWNINDTHGTGIILMAIVETENMLKSL